jgi:RNA polymerase sigma factor (sigma-70 family)
MALTLSVTQPAPPSCSEHELVAAVRRGNDRAFEELFGRYRDRIGSYVFGMLGDHGRAEDVTQEVFISALRRLRDTECPIAFQPWVYQIARNACIDEFRRTRRAKEVPLDSSDEREGVDYGIPSPTPTPDAAVENKQRFDDLRGAFRGLSESHHRVIVMRELEGLSYEQIGDRLGMSKPMVESTLFRARRRLSDEYDELVSGRRCEHVQTLIAAGDERPLRSLGLRERRQFARHVAHCQPCRRHARMAGVEDSLFQTPGLIGKIAALFPLPWLRWRRSHTDDDAIAASGSHQVTALQSLSIQTVAQVADPSGPMTGLGRAAATAAAIVVAGAGGGVVTGLGGHGGFPVTRAAAQHSAAAARTAGALTNVRARGGGASALAAPASVGSTSVAAASGGSSSASSAASPPARGAAKTSGSGSTLSGVTSGAASVVQHSAAGAGSAASSATKGAGLGGLHLPALGGSPSSGSSLPKLPSVTLPKVPNLPGVGSLGSGSSSSGSSSGLPPLPTLSTPKLPTVSTPKLPPVALPKLPVPSVPSVPDPGKILPKLGLP